MKYLLVSIFLLFGLGCAQAPATDDIDNLEITDNTVGTKADADAFAEFDTTSDVEAVAASSTTTNPSKEVMSEVNDIEESMNATATPAAPAHRTRTRKPAAQKSTDSASAASTGTQPFYTVQVGAYPSKELAKKRAAVLGLNDVSYQETNVGGKKWQRVLVGRFESKKSAEAFKKQMPGDTIIRSVQPTDASLWH